MHAAEDHRFIGIDVGGTKIAAGVARFPEGKPLLRETIPTNAQRSGEAVLEDVIALARKLATDAGNVRGIGLGICELVDRSGAIASNNCIDWLRLPVSERLSSIAPSVIEADVRAAALAEAAFGAGKPFRIFLYVTIGTGISCALMINGSPFLGASGATGTLASSPLGVSCDSCGSVNRRTLEEIASGPAIIARYNERGGFAKTGQDVLNAAASGDQAARDTVRIATRALGSQVGLLVNVLDPEAVIIGGGLGLSEGAYWEGLIAATREHIWSARHRNIPILPAATGSAAGWLGAAARAAATQS